MGGLFGSSNAQQQPVALGSVNIQQSSYAVPITIVYGTNRASGNLIWYGAFTQTQSTTGGASGKGGGGGGGGKGGGSQEYEYSASFQIGICEGPITGVGLVWITKQITDLPAAGGVLSIGSLTQSPWSYLVTNFPSQADPYNRLAHADFANFQLGTSAEMPQFSFEVQGLLIIGNGNQDAYADQVFIDFLKRANFPSAYLGDFTNAGLYWQAMGFFISPIIDQQRQATDWLKEWMDTLNAEFVWSNGKLTVVPYADSTITGNGVTYTPNLTPVYALTDDDFLVNGDEDPVQIERNDMPDAYNQMPIEYINRADQYNTETFTAEDQGMIDNYGPRIGSTLTAHHVTDPNVAQTMVYLKLWRTIYVDSGNQYTFKLPWNYILLDPMDLVSLTTGTLLNNVLVRIKKIEEDADGILTFTCEDVPGQIAAPALYSSQGTQRFVANYNGAPANVNVPVIFETPLALVQASDVEVNLAVSGQNANWGGCQVWTSTDGEVYQNIGTILGSARQGFLTSALADFSPPGNGNNIDGTDTLAIDMTESRGGFNNAAVNADATANNTLCYVDGEFLSFGNDALTTQYKYNLTYLNRGAYSSVISQHAQGSVFVRYDASVFRYSIDQSRVGQTLYFKFLSFNVYGGGLQQLADVTASTYQVTGIALLTPLPNISSLAVNYSNGIAQLNWAAVTDIRSPIQYEVRKGSSWAAGQFLGRTTAPNFAVYGTDSYWVSPLFITPMGVNVYSSVPPGIAVTAPSIQQNVINSWDEEATGWTGTLGGGAVLNGTEIVLGGSTNILTIPNLLALPNMLSGSVVTSGSYTAPSAHTITSNYVCDARVVINWQIAGVNVSGAGDIVLTPDITALTDVTDSADQSYVYALAQVSLSQDGVTFGAFENWTPGVYTFLAIKFQILIFTTNTQVNAVLSGFSYEVDVDQQTQTGTVATVNTGPIAVTFANKFNEMPLIHLTIVSASAGDQAILTGEATTGFSVEVLNSGSPVVRTVNWSATGF